jgi:hypothetical protein
MPSRTTTDAMAAARRGGGGGALLRRAVLLQRVPQRSGGRRQRRRARGGRHARTAARPGHAAAPLEGWRSCELRSAGCLRAQHHTHPPLHPFAPLRSQLPARTTARTASLCAAKPDTSDQSYTHSTCTSAGGASRAAAQRTCSSSTARHARTAHLAPSCCWCVRGRQRVVVQQQQAQVNSAGWHQAAASTPSGLHHAAA